MNSEDKFISDTPMVMGRSAGRASEAGPAGRLQPPSPRLNPAASPTAAIQQLGRRIVRIGAGGVVRRPALQFKLKLVARLILGFCRRGPAGMLRQGL